MRGIVRAAAYCPGAGSPRAGSRTADEDRFTLEATALERLLDGRPDRPGTRRIRTVGPLPSVASWAFPAWVGTPSEITSYGAGVSGLEEAMAASIAGGGPEIVVASDLDTGVDGAVAFLVSEVGGTDTPGGVRPPAADDEEAVLPAAVARWKALPARAREGWVGDWAELDRPSPTGPRVPHPDPVPAGVSEGAYLPRPRYLEGLSSRWRLIAERCSSCGRTSFPVRGRCRGCGRREGLSEVALPRAGGSISAITWIGPGGQPTEFDAQVESSGGYGVAIVELIPGTLGTFQLTDVARGELAIGAKVRTGLRRLYGQEGEWRYGRKAMPLAPGS